MYFFPTSYSVTETEFGHTWGGLLFLFLVQPEQPRLASNMLMKFYLLVDLISGIRHSDSVKVWDNYWLQSLWGSKTVYCLVLWLVCF